MQGLAAVLLALATAAAGAQTVSLHGMLGPRALLVVDGGPPKSVAPGESWQGVKVVSTQGDQAVLEFGGQRVTLRVGDAPFGAGPGAAAGPAAGRGNRIVLQAGSGGHFVTLGAINGKTVQFVVDTGASGVSMSVADAERIGLAYQAGEQIRLSTANGLSSGWRVKLASVRIGDVEVFEVDATVTPSNMPYVLLGNSFLSRFNMRRENEQMTLERRF